MLNNSPLITVYITNYNYGRYIRQAIESVLAQSFQNFEIIIIDDGSSDNSQEIIESYAKHPKIDIIFQKNKGLNVTNNIAMRLAKGKYLMRLDADDFLEPNALEVMVGKLEADNELGLVFPDYYLVNEEGNTIAQEQRHSFKKDVSLLDQPAHGACTMIRMAFLEELGGYNESFNCQDGYELWIKFIAHFKVDNVNVPLFHYRQHGANLTRNENKILKTRARIKETFAKGHNIKVLNTIAIIPIRGKGINSNSVAFEELGDKLVLEKKIDSALAAKNISKVVVTSPDKAVKDFVKTHYKGNTKLIFIDRPEELARFNTDLKATISHILNHKEIVKVNPEAFMTLAIEYPFTSTVYIDDAVYTMSIFDTDSLISVRPDSHLFFQHHGQGMKPILNQTKFTRLERDALYKYVGGIMVTTLSLFKKSNTQLGTRVGHIVIDQKAAHCLTSQQDLEIARFLIAKDIPVLA